MEKFCEFAFFLSSSPFPYIPIYAYPPSPHSQKLLRYQTRITIEVIDAILIHENNITNPILKSKHVLKNITKEPVFYNTIPTHTTHTGPSLIKYNMKLLQLPHNRSKTHLLYYSHLFVSIFDCYISQFY